jgi:hypothetical protein
VTDEGRAFCGQRGELEGRIITERRLHFLPFQQHPERKEMDVLPGTRTLYCVASRGVPGEVDFCKATCYCAPCAHRDFEACEAPTALGTWDTHVLTLTP